MIAISPLFEVSLLTVPHHLSLSCGMYQTDGRYHHPPKTAEQQTNDGFGLSVEALSLQAGSMEHLEHSLQSTTPQEQITISHDLVRIAIPYNISQ